MIGTILETGALCEIDGIWKVQGTPSTAIRATKGMVMPQFRGENVAWRMIQHLPRRKEDISKKSPMPKEKKVPNVIVIHVE